MLRRSYRLRRRRDIDRVHRHGQRFQTQNLSLKYAPSQLRRPRIVVVVSTKVSKKATQRNRLRRRLIGQIRPLLPQLSRSVDMVLLPQLSLVDKSAPELQAELLALLDKAQLLAASPSR